MKPENFLNVYSPYRPHDISYIVGSRDELEKLKTAVDQALSDNKSSVESFTNDGEGYNLVIIKLEDQEKINQLITPYTDEIMRYSKDLDPWEL